MTYAEWRAHGYVSKLNCLECKGPGQQISTAGGITQQQLQAGSTAGKQSADDYSQFKSLLAPLITQQTSLASGDRNAALSAAMPIISKLSSGFQGAKQNILNNMPPGPARDRALADLQTQAYTTEAGAQAGLVQQAPSVLAGAGTQFGNMSLSELAASLNALSGGSQTNQGAGQMAAAQQASLLNFFGDLAKAGGTAAGGWLGCWIAEAIYGVDDPRTHVLRRWLNGEFCNKPFGAIVMALYRCVGRPVAWCARRSRLLRAALLPLFNRALHRALR